MGHIQEAVLDSWTVSPLLIFFTVQRYIARRRCVSVQVLGRHQVRGTPTSLSPLLSPPIEDSSAWPPLLPSSFLHFLLRPLYGQTSQKQNGKELQLIQVHQAVSMIRPRQSPNQFPQVSTKPSHCLVNHCDYYFPFSGGDLISQPYSVRHIVKEFPGNNGKSGKNSFFPLFFIYIVSHIFSIIFRLF